MYRTIIDRRQGLLGFLLFGAIFVVINVKSGWSLVNRAGFPNKNHFDDLSLVVNWAECFNEIGNKVYSTQSQDVCGGYLYGQTLLNVVNFLNISKSQVALVSAFLIVASVFCFATIAANSQKKTFSSILIVTALIFSPNYMLLIERMNVDLIVILMLALAAFTLRRGNFATSFALVATTALFKFYTLPLLVFISIKYVTGKKRIVALLLTGVVALNILLDLQKIKETFPSTWFISFGLQIWGKYLGLFIEALSMKTTKFTWPVETLVGLTLLLLVSLVFLLLDRFLKPTHKSIFHLRQVGKEDLLSFEFLSIPFLTCYFINTSYDYRLPLLSVAFCLVLKYQSGIGYRIFVGFALMATWMTVFVPFPASSGGVTLWQLIGDLSMLPLVVALLLLLAKSSRNRWALKLRGSIGWN